MAQWPSGWGDGLVINRSWVQCNLGHAVHTHTHGSGVTLAPRHRQLKGSMKELNISIYFFLPPITQGCSISDALFTGGRGVTDFSVLKYY